MENEVYVNGDKFPRTVEVMETVEAARAHLIKQGFDGNFYMTKRKSKRSDQVFYGLAYKNAKTGEYVFAL